LQCEVAGDDACTGAGEDAVAVKESVEEFVASGVHGDEFVVALGGKPSSVESAHAAVAEVVELERPPGPWDATGSARDRPAAFGSAEPVVSAAEPGE
jgi:hypothetical protein